MILHFEDSEPRHCDLSGHTRISSGDDVLLVDHENLFHDRSRNERLITRLADDEYERFGRDMLDGFSVVRLKENRLHSFVCDVSGVGRLYFYRDSDTLVLSDDVFSLRDHLGRRGIDLDVDPELASEFAKTGRCPPGHTFLDRVYKTIPGIVHDRRGEPGVDLAQHLEPTHESWKEAFELTIRRVTRKFDEVCLLFSGGLDSTAILAACNEVAPDTPVTCLTLIPPEELRDRRLERQLDNVGRVTARFRCEHRFVQMSDVDDFLDQYVRIFPFEKAGIPFLPALEHARDAGLEDALFLCGQNADSLANLGQTRPLDDLSLRKKASVLALRFLTSRHYMDWPGMRVRSLVLDTLGFGRRVRLPRSREEYWRFYRNPEIPRLPLVKAEASLGESPTFPPEEMSLSKAIFLANVRSYNDADTQKSFYASCRLADVQGFLPYSSSLMTSFALERFEEMPLRLQLRPKHDIRSYVSRFVDLSLFRVGYLADDPRTEVKLENKERLWRRNVDQAIRLLSGESEKRAAVA